MGMRAGGLEVCGGFAQLERLSVLDDDYSECGAPL